MRILVEANAFLFGKAPSISIEGECTRPGRKSSISRSIFDRPMSFLAGCAPFYVFYRPVFFLYFFSHFFMVALF